MLDFRLQYHYNTGMNICKMYILYSVYIIMIWEFL